jgi:hypothetical protein
LTAKRITQKALKIIAFILGSILVLMTTFHFWFINHAESLVEDMVSSQSGGKLKLEIDRFKFNWFNYRMELRKSVFSSTDTSVSTTYQFKVEKITITIKEILPLVLEKKILIDSIYLLRPDIRVTKMRSSRDTTSSADSGLSIPQEMGKIYNSIQDALKVLEVDRFTIAKGKFSLIDRTHPTDPPVVITDIHFRLDNLQVDTTKPGTEKKILFSDNVSLHTNNQDILFPDGRHRLAFSKFRIDVLNRLAEFDSCTIVATKGDSASNSFRIFFDKLQMTNIDFATLYHHEIIKADSVYCINPRFRLDVDIPKKNDAKRSLPKLDELVQELTGDLQLAFVVVENGAFDINTNRDGRLSSFTSDHNNFELQGLRIKASDPKPLTVEKFVMAIRNYENFLKDSSYSIQFDSVLLYNNRVSLSNFTYQELEANKPVNTLRMPQFELQGLSWDDLVFEQKLKAEAVTLYRPVIDYKISGSKQGNSQDIFQTLAGIGNFMQLKNLSVNDGQFNLVFKNNARLRLENANMYVLGEQLVGSKKLQNIQRSVVGLDFRKGSFQMGDISADLADVNFTGGTSNQLRAGNVHVKNKNTLDIQAQSVSVHSMMINDKIQQTAISGVSWAKAAILLSSLPGMANRTASQFTLRDIHANNTTIKAEEGEKKISLFLRDFIAEEISSRTERKLFIGGLRANGNDLAINQGNIRFHIRELQLADQQRSRFADLEFYQGGEDSVYVSVPKLEFVPDLNNILAGNLDTDDLTITSPDIKVNLAGDNAAGARWFRGKIGKLHIIDPNLQFASKNENGTTKLDWNGKGQQVEIFGLQLDQSPLRSLTADQLKLLLHHFNFVTNKGKIFNAGDGRLAVEMKNLKLKNNDAGAWDWKAVITKLNAENFVVDSLGKKAGRLTIASARLDDFSIHSTQLLDPGKMIRENITFRLKELTGSYINSAEAYHWYNTGYDKYTRMFTADSFTYRPVKDRDSFMANARYQTDYIEAKTGAIHIGPFNLDRYLQDTVLDLGNVDISNGYMTDYRDQRLPRPPGISRSLPVKLLRQIPAKLIVDTVRLSDAHIEYEEFNPKTRASGTIRVARLNGQIAHLKNFDPGNRDSLHISASAYLEDSLHTTLRLREAYMDSLGGFVMNVEMGPADLTILNPVLRPLASAELKSGSLDTMSMQVNGREAFAHGEMKMVYRDFKINVVRPDGKRKRGLLSLIANSLIKNQNTSRKGTVYFKRLRDRSAINYLVKITLSGVSSSIGIRKPDRQARQNKAFIQSSPVK